MLDSSAHHTLREFDAEMRAVRERFASMAARCRDQLQLALDAFWTGSKDKVAAVKASDEAVNADEKAIDALVLRVLALRQPVASDLRALTAVFKIVTDLERIGDEAVDITRGVAPASGDAEPIRARLRQMAEVSEKMFNSAASSFLDRDAAAAGEVLRPDGLVDSLYEGILRDSIAFMTRNPADVASMTAAMNVARGLGRIADHARNIAEGTLFVLRNEAMPR